MNDTGSPQELNDPSSLGRRFFFFSSHLPVSVLAPLVQVALTSTLFFAHLRKTLVLFTCLIT